MVGGQVDMAAQSPMPGHGRARPAMAGQGLGPGGPGTDENSEIGFLWDWTRWPGMRMPWEVVNEVLHFFPQLSRGRLAVGVVGRTCFFCLVSSTYMLAGTIWNHLHLPSASQ